MASTIARRLEGKVALITGAASGLGESMSRLLSRNGARIVIADIQDELGQKICQDLDPSLASFVHCDVTKENDISDAINATISKHGKLDIMVNNAGIVGQAGSNILDNEKADFERVISINLVGTFLGIKHAARVMIPARYGTIINTASVCAGIGGLASHAYTSSKHGVLGLTRNAAIDLGRHGIRVNCVSPYVVETAMGKYSIERNYGGLGKIYSHLNGAILKPEDVADAALYLASDESKYVSGHNLIVDGGFTVVNPNCCMYKKSNN